MSSRPRSHTFLPSSPSTSLQTPPSPKTPSGREGNPTVGRTLDGRRTREVGTGARVVTGDPHSVSSSGWKEPKSYDPRWNFSSKPPSLYFWNRHPSQEFRNGHQLSRNHGWSNDTTADSWTGTTASCTPLPSTRNHTSDPFTTARHPRSLRHSGTPPRVPPDRRDCPCTPPTPLYLPYPTSGCLGRAKEEVSVTLLLSHLRLSGPRRRVDTGKTRHVGTR